MAAAPDAVAIATRSQVCTYGELAERANAVAHAIVERVGVGPEPVAVLAGHDIAALVAILGVVESGRPFVVLDPVAPAARVEQIASLAGAVAGLVDDDHTNLAEDLGSTVPTWIPIGDEVAPHPPELARPSTGTDTACVLFTSGSTGEPKGVRWLNQTLLSDAHSGFQALGVAPGDRMALVLPFSFAAGLTVVAFGLANGATLSLFDPRAQGVATMADWIDQDGITTLHATPSLLRSLLRAMEPGRRLDGLRLVTSCGEAIHGSDVARIRSHLGAAAPFVNWTGSSEVGVLSFFAVAPDAPLPEGTVPSGRVVDDKAITIDGDDGESGEVIVTSHYLGGGYWHDHEATAGRFVTLPDGQRRFRTGDLGRQAPDGSLQLLGRLDSALKIRGYLVEPSEVEAVLAGAADVAEVVVVGERRPEAPARLIAYVVPVAGASLSVPALRRLVRERLPAWMVPSRVIPMAALPRNERGKVDRTALPPPSDEASGELVAPRTEWEVAVADLWAGVLGLDEVGVHEDFTELGGDSLAAEELLSAAEASFGMPVPSSLLIESPTVAELAARLASARSVTAAPTIVPLRAATTRPPLFCVAGAGGISMVFSSLSRRLPADQAIYAMHEHGLESRAVPSLTVRQAARRHLQSVRTIQPRGPYVLMGHSMGGLVALEMAHQLQAVGEEVALLALVDTYLPGAAQGGEVVEVQRDATGAAQVRGQLDRLWRVRSFKTSTLGNVARMATAGLVQLPGQAQYDAFYRRGILMSQLYRPQPYSGRTTIYAAQDNSDGVDHQAWSRVLTGPWDLCAVPGDHHSLLREPNVIQIADHLTAELDRL